jgi:hypothetical protein
MADLPVLPEPQLTESQVAAIGAADNPDFSNPFVTRKELFERHRIVTRAAGRLDLADPATGPETLGNLRITHLDAKNARFKATFAGYSQARSDNYVLNALTVHDHGTNENRIYKAELVRFEADGFVMHMSRFPGGKAELSPGCMIEVKEII